MYAEHRHGALTVLEQAHTKDHVQRELRSLDVRLFLEKQVTVSDKLPVWCVCMDLGDRGGGVYTLLEHRDENGTPIGYPTTRLCDEVRRMMARGPVDVKEIDRRNTERREERRRKIYSDVREMAHERYRSAHPLFSSLLPRSRSLQLARQKQKRVLTPQQLAVAAHRRRAG